MANGIGRARLAIPKVNVNPKPPGISPAKAVLGKSHLGNAQVVTPAAPKPTVNPASKPSPALTQAANNITNTNWSGIASQAGAAGAAAGSTAAASAATAAPPAPPKERFAIPTWSPKVAGEPDPRDSTYWANLAKLKFTDEQEYNKANEEETKGNAGYSYALQQAITNRGVQERQLGENAIKGNLSASGWLDRTQGEQTRAYTGERQQAALTHEQELHAWNTARHALEEGFGIEAAEKLAEAATRYGESHKNEAEEGEPEYAGGGAAPAPNPVAAALTYKPGSAGNKNNTKNAGIGNNQKAGAGGKQVVKGSNGGTTAPDNNKKKKG